ncbi:MAG: NifB/NifX family molybdenum-iron cluster-binding protein [Acidobacteriaceae bacterium]
MKLAITSTGEGLNASLDPHFGRARYLIVVDSETNAVETVSNAVNLNIAQGAGIQAAKRIMDLGAQTLITGQVGPKAAAALQAGGVAVYAAAGRTVADALEAFRSGSLHAITATTPGGQGEWPQ